MRTLAAYGAGVMVAAALPVLVVTFLAIASGDMFNRFALMSLAWGACLALAISAAVAVPTLLLLHRLGAVRWLWLGVSGFSSGCVLYGYYLVSTRQEPFAVPMSPVAILVASMIGGIVGWMCASACWFTIRFFMRPNTSLERTRGE